MFDGVAETKKAALIPYLTAGYPKKADTVDLLLALQACAVNEIHLTVCVSISLYICLTWLGWFNVHNRIMYFSRQEDPP